MKLPIIDLSIHMPRRGDEVDQYLKRQRDIYPETSNEWDALNAVVDDYRLRSDQGLNLTVSTEDYK